MGKQSVHAESFKAGADLSATQYRFVKLSAADTVVAAAATSDLPVGVQQDKNTSGNEVNVMMIGRSFVEAGAAISVGALVGSNASGKAVAKTTNDNVVMGMALTAAAADGDLFEAYIYGPVAFRTAV